MIGGDLPLILPSELGGYWLDPPLERLVDVSPTSTQCGLGPESYDIMERDGEAKIYHDFFCSRVNFMLCLNEYAVSSGWVLMFYIFLL